jgi:hypothetical protein
MSFVNEKPLKKTELIEVVMPMNATQSRSRNGIVRGMWVKGIKRTGRITGEAAVGGGILDRGIGTRDAGRWIFATLVFLVRICVKLFGEASP